MKTLNIEHKYLEKIRELYYKYKDKSIDLENGLIIVRELIYNPDILILGLNPSRNKKHDDDVKRQNNIAFWYPYVIPDIKGITFTSLEDYHYIKERNIYINPYIYEKYYKNFIRKTLLHSWEYFDLFWIRKTNASELFSDNNIDFLKEQSKLSIEIITEIKPKIIIGAYKSLDYFINFVDNKQFTLINSEEKLKELLNNNFLNDSIIVLKYLTYLPKPGNLGKYINTINFLINYLNYNTE